MNARKELEKYLGSVVTDTSTNLTLDKFYDRAADIIEKDGKLYFEMERHSRTLGGQYYKGSPMAACTTRLEKYMFDPDQGRILIIDVSEESIDPRTINYTRLAEDNLFDVSFSYKKHHGRGYLMQESLVNFEAIVSNKRDVSRAVREYASNLNFEEDSSFELLLKNQAEKVIKKLEKECYKQLLERAITAWEEK